MQESIPKCNPMYTRKTMAFETLARPARAAYLVRFLSELANLRSEDDSMERFLRDFAEMIPFLPPWSDDAVKVVTEAGFSRDYLEKKTRQSTLWSFREQLIRIWREPDLRSKQY